MKKEIYHIPDRGNKKRVVIIGGGFGGLKATRKMDNDKFQVVLIDRNNYHLFQPLLYQVATAGIEPSSISFPFRKVFRKHDDFHIRVCEALNVRPEEKVVETSIGEIEYDYVIIATGCSPNYFGNDMLAQETMPLKATADALYIRNEVLETFEKAQNTDDPLLRVRLLTIVVVGAGATGVELAGALAELRNFILPCDYPDLELENMKIILVDGSPRVLSGFSEKSYGIVDKKLKELGVEIILNTHVKDYKEDVLQLSTGNSIIACNVFWTAEVKANSIQGFPKDCYGHSNRLIVDEFNHVTPYEDVFAIGDTALMTLPDYPKGHPQVVQPALQQGKNVVKNLERLQKGKPLKPFDYFNKGSMATIERNSAVVELKHLNFGGFIAWCMWLFIHLISILGIKNKLFVMMDWTWSYFRYDPSMRLLIKPVVKDKTDVKSAPETADEIRQKLNNSSSVNSQKETVRY